MRLAVEITDVRRDWISFRDMYCSWHLGPWCVRIGRWPGYRALPFERIRKLFSWRPRGMQ